MLIISDFSKTFTTAMMPSTWSAFAKSGILWEGYLAERNTLFDRYFHYEQEGNIEKTNEWFRLHAALFVKYGLTLAQIQALVSDNSLYQTREGVSDFIDAVRTQGHTLVIISSGFTAVIKAWFDMYHIDYRDIHIIANEFVFDSQGRVISIGDLTRTPLDKYAGTDSLIEKADILLGDSPEDIPNSFLWNSYGFTDEEKGFVVKLGKEGNMKDVIEYLK